MKRLTLNRETVRKLNLNHLHEVFGGGKPASKGKDCTLTQDWTCESCVGHICQTGEGCPSVIC